ncbi:SubName: Full=Uncharacterized protein {ECO:0000313/EMBL:CCA68844.1} [Serendipita indica DSM 11827]|nr:SubName: Full=Uncharacterized protein {ECO:0000313/EMBL:CCA68844.1} [Serendipita indica DSM 11827]
MTEEESRIPPLTYYCYQSVYAHIDRLSSLGRLPYKLIKPVLFAVDADTLKHLEQGYDDWQRNEYLDPTDGSHSRRNAKTRLAAPAIGYHGFASRKKRINARRNSFTIYLRQEDEETTRVGTLTPSSYLCFVFIDLPYAAFRKVVADTRKMSIAAPNQQAVHRPYPMPNFRPPSTMPIRTEPTHQSRSKGSPHPRSSQSTLFIPKSRP